MSPREVGWRAADQVRERRWARRRVPAGAAHDRQVPGLLGDRRFPAVLPDEVRGTVPAPVAAAVTDAAEALLAGRWEVLGVPRPDIVDPDWFRDPVTGRRAPQDELAFRIDHRDEQVTGNVKSVWELSRHHHLTVLAAAWWLTREDRFAQAVARQLESWWRANPFLSGIHWTSGIELGIRLTSWVWVRRLLDSWPGCRDLFEQNDLALRQIRWHQEYLASFRSRGSSANNHAVAEASGRLVAACAFPWFQQSERWREQAASDLARSLAANTFGSGVNRELASDYHRFVTELGLVALAESNGAGRPLPRKVRELLASSLDAAAALLDASGRAPRQGDGDEGRALVLDPPTEDAWASLLSTGSVLVGAPGWWPRPAPDLASALLGSLGGIEPVGHRAESRPDAFPDAGIHLLRTPRGSSPEIWCRCDGGPHGFLSLAAHGHADALSIEVRHGGVDILADPGTYCYHGEPVWRSYFRSTRAHNTVEVDGVSQSVEGGPFLWRTRTDAAVDGTERTGDLQVWSAHHVGYRRLDPALRHSRTVSLDAAKGQLTVLDELVGEVEHSLRLNWHLGPQVQVDLRTTSAELRWVGTDGAGTGALQLPEQLSWSRHTAETDPILGWYSPGFGQRVPSTTLVGTGSWTGTLELRTLVRLSGGFLAAGGQPMEWAAGATSGAGTTGPSLTGDF